MDGPGQLSQAFGRIASLIREDRCVVLDGGIGTEVEQVVDSPVQLDERDWGTRALIDAPDTVLDVHRAYVAAGCDLITTNTWGLSGLRGSEPAWQPHAAAIPVSWLDVARRALELARRAAEEAEPGNEVAVAFSLNGELDSEEGRETARLLARTFEDGPAPDLLLVETLSVVRPSLFDSISVLLETGVPVWLSFRRCRHGLCGVFGQHWGGPEGDAFGRAAHQFEEVGVGALLVNCIPPDHIDGMVSFLRDFTDLPLGVYPNLGYFSDAGWRFDAGIGPDEYARMALRWREEGAQIIGGCCGVRPEHVRAAAVALEGTARGQRRREEVRAEEDEPAAEEAVASPWVDGRGRRVYPLAFPDLVIDEGVAPPDDAEFMAWRYLAREGVGAHQTCLDIGCGTGLLGIQLALNGAQRVRSIDIDRAAVANTRTNAYRNAVDDRLDAAVVDLYPWVPEEPYDLIVASLVQTPTDPLEAATLHRPTDFWGRGLVDQLLGKIDEALAPDGVAYVVQYSILSQQRTANLMAKHGMSAEVADFSVFGFSPDMRERLAQVELVEELSDAYHLRLGDEHAMVAYLLEVRRSSPSL